MHLELGANGVLMVVAPKHWPRHQVETVLKNNTRRVERFLNAARQRKCEPLQYKHGEMHLFVGEAYPLHIQITGQERATVSFDGQQICVAHREGRGCQVQAALQRWYLQQARRLFQHRLVLIAARAPWAEDRKIPLRLRKMKRTWGNCSSNGDIKLNTQLVKAPLHIIDSVIAHEICHLEEMNHGPAFYALLQALNPNWRTDRQTLRRDGNNWLR
jgi:predicted metal-dependent hydrolase